MSVYSFIIRDEVINCQLSSSVNIIYDIRKGHSVVWVSLPAFCSDFRFSALRSWKSTASYPAIFFTEAGVCFAIPLIWGRKKIGVPSPFHCSRKQAEYPGKVDDKGDIQRYWIPLSCPPFLLSAENRWLLLSHRWSKYSNLFLSIRTEFVILTK